MLQLGRSARFSWGQPWLGLAGKYEEFNLKKQFIDHVDATWSRLRSSPSILITTGVHGDGYADELLEREHVHAILL